MPYGNVYFLVNFGWDTDGTADRSFGSCPQSNVECSCQSLTSCAWTVKMIKSVSRLPQNHPTKQKVINFIFDRSCAKGRVKNKVYCCDGRKGTFPTDCKLKQIKNPRPKTKPRPTSNTGGNVPAGNREVRYHPRL